MKRQTQYSFIFTCIMTFLLGTTTVHAIMPHEVAVLINTNDASSIRVGEFYAQARLIPADNIIRVGVPDQFRHRIGNKKFTELIWNPATNYLTRANLDNQIVAWVYSCGFPVAVGPDPDCSLTGLTFTRNQRPEDIVIKNAGATSKLFAGPQTPTGMKGPSATFDHYRSALRTRMPLPSMMLGYTGPGGNTEESIVRLIERGLQADFSQPRSSEVIFVNREDIRWRCREWQLEPTLAEFKELGIPSRIVPRIPGKSKALLGVYTGTQRFEIETLPGFVPGAIADHLTSFGGHFEQKFQMNISDWFKKGATAAAGTVFEPYAIWAKFPHMRIYAHYARGCSVIESYYQSVRFPHQLIIMGDPLCRPFAPNIEGTFTYKNSENGRTGKFENKNPSQRCSIQVIANGRPAGRRQHPNRFILPATGDVTIAVVVQGAVTHYKVFEVPD